MLDATKRTAAHGVALFSYHVSWPSSLEMGPCVQLGANAWPVDEVFGFPRRRREALPVSLTVYHLSERRTISMCGSSGAESKMPPMFTVFYCLSHSFRYYPDSNTSILFFRT